MVSTDGLSVSSWTSRTVESVRHRYGLVATADKRFGVQSSRQICATISATTVEWGGRKSSGDKSIRQEAQKGRV